MSSLKVNFRLEKTTTGAYRYKEIDDKGHFHEDMRSGAVGTLYLRKDKLEGTPKNEISITVEY